MSILTRLRLSLYLVLFTCIFSFGQAGAPAHPFTMIRGYVKDAVTHAGIEHVIVTLDRETSGYVGQAETDHQGKFTFNAPGQEIFRISVRPPGYEGETKRVDLRTASSDYVTFELRPAKKPGSSAAVPDDNLGPRDVSIPEKAWEEYVKAHHSMGDKDVEASVRHLQKAIKIYPGFSQAYATLGVAYIAQSKLDDARGALEKSIELNPKSAPPYITLGMLLNHEKEYTGAEKNLSRGVELDPNAPEAHYELAKAYLALQRWPDAELHAQKAAELRPDMAPAHIVLGNIALHKSDNQAALKEFKEYLRLDPHGPMAAGAQQMVERIEQARNQPQ
jgi:Flp pilus assembly protein TadD